MKSKVLPALHCKTELFLENQKGALPVFVLGHSLCFHSATGGRSLF